MNGNKEDFECDFPTTNTSVSVPLTSRGASQLKQKADRLGRPVSHLMRQGVDWIVDLASENSTVALKEVLRPSGLYPCGRERESGYAFVLCPARMAGLIRAVGKIDQTAQEIVQESGLSDLYPSPEPLLGQGPPSGMPSDWQPSLRKRIIRTAGRKALEDFEEDDIGITCSSEREPGYQKLEKRPGADRGGTQIVIGITRSAKKRMTQAAREANLEASDLVRREIRNVIRWAEEDPKNAFDYIRQESSLQEMPRKGSYSGYNVYVESETKRLLRWTRELLRRGPGEGSCPTEGDIKEAAVRRAINGSGPKLPLPGEG
jgi:hypothetical protein